MLSAEIITCAKTLESGREGWRRFAVQKSLIVINDDLIPQEYHGVAACRGLRNVPSHGRVAHGKNKVTLSFGSNSSLVVNATVKPGEIIHTMIQKMTDKWRSVVSDKTPNDTLVAFRA